LLSRSRIFNYFYLFLSLLIVKIFHIQGRGPKEGAGSILLNNWPPKTEIEWQEAPPPLKKKGRINKEVAKHYQSRKKLSTRLAP
jgi:hypothetical protein